MSNFYIIKLIPEPLTLRQLCSSTLRSNEKYLVERLLWGQKLVEKVFNSKNFGFEQLLYNKVDFGASVFEATVQLQIEVKQKMLGRSVAFRVKSVKKALKPKTFFI